MPRLIAAALFSSLAAATPASAIAGDGEGSCEPHMVAAAARYDIPLAVLYAVGLTETGRGDSLRPHALNIEGRAIYNLDRAAALAEIAAARAAGRKLIDIGCMQINLHYHADRFSSVADMLDPARNVAYAARFLKELRQREGSWTMAVARYHAGPANVAAHARYLCRVIANMVATGFGAWTPAARAYCAPSAEPLTASRNP